MRVLITGATGFVGRNVVKAFLAQGAEVACLVRRPGSEELLGQRTVEAFYGQVTDPAALKNIFHRVDVAVHLVAIIREKGKLTLDLINHQGTRNVVAAAKEEGVKRFVHMSAVGAGPATSYPYLHSKWMGEQEVVKSGIPYTILQPSIQFGEGDEFINTLAGLVRAFPVVPVAGSGRNLFQPVAVEEVAQCVANVAGREEYTGQIMGLGGPEVLTYNQIIDIIAETYGVKRVKLHIPVPIMRQMVRLMELTLSRPPVTLGQLKMLPVDNVPESNKAEELLGFMPRPLKGNIEYIKQIGFTDGLRIALGFMPRHIRDH